MVYLLSTHKYRMLIQLAVLGWFDFDLGCSTILLSHFCPNLIWLSRTRPISELPWSKPTHPSSASWGNTLYINAHSHTLLPISHNKMQVFVSAATNVELINLNHPHWLTILQMNWACPLWWRAKTSVSDTALKSQASYLNSSSKVLIGLIKLLLPRLLVTATGIRSFLEVLFIFFQEFL